MTTHEKISYNNEDNDHGHGKSSWDYTFNLKFLKLLLPDVSLEIGVWKGSTFQILHKYSKTAIGVDDQSWTFKESYPKEWNIKIMDSRDLSPKHINFNKINFAHISGDHELESVLKDYEFVKNNLANDGIICIDDYITHRDVFVATQYFLRANRNFFIKFYGYNQAYITTLAGAEIIDSILKKITEKDKKQLKIENTYTMNIIPKNYYTDIDLAIKTNPDLQDDLKKFYRDFNK